MPLWGIHDPHDHKGVVVGGTLDGGSDSNKLFALRLFSQQMIAGLSLGRMGLRRTSCAARHQSRLRRSQRNRRNALTATWSKEFLPVTAGAGLDPM